MTEKIQRIAVVGCGWLGMPLALRLKQRGFDVRGSRRHASLRDELTAAEIPSTALSLTPTISCDDPQLLFAHCDLVVINIPWSYKHEASYVYQQVAALTQIVLAYQIPRVLFVSSTSVFNASQGVIDQFTRPEPASEYAQMLFRIEQQLSQNPHFKCHILRFGGLFGPKRHPGRFLAGREVDGGSTPVNLIHQRDCIDIIHAIIKRDLFPLQLNACSDAHPFRSQFYVRAAQSIGLEPPKFSQDNSTHKKIDNTYLKQSLNYTFSYPDPLQWIEDQEN